MANIVGVLYASGDIAPQGRKLMFLVNGSTLPSTRYKRPTLKIWRLIELNLRSLWTYYF